MTDPLRVLVVDDDSQMLRTISDILRFRGYDAVGATSGHAGLEAVQSRGAAPSIALIDLKLPDMDGIELVARLRDIVPLVEVVILTGNASVESAVGALRQHTYDYLVKPVAPDHLVTSIARAGDRWQRRRAEAALEQSEARLRHMFECVSDAVFITDDDQRVIDANRAAVTLTRRSVDELRDARLDALLDGVASSVDVRSAVFAPGMHVHSVRDLSEQRRLELALRHAQKMEAVGRLAGGVAHDFNNMLTVITSFTGLLEMSSAMTSDDRTMLHEIQGAADRGAALTRQLLALSRKSAMSPRVLNLNEVVTGISAITARVLGDDIPLHLRLSDDIDPVLADQGQLEQVIVNLVVNARDAMPDGGTLTIMTANAQPDVADAHVSKPSANGYVGLYVSDTGTGMSADTIERIFEPFFTTKSEGKGTGLGLATVHGIIEQSGGFTRVQSAIGEGTTFAIHLPRYVQEPEKKNAT